MRFSELFDVAFGAGDDWFDPVLSEDTPLYVDPFLLYDDADPAWSACHDTVVEFFSMTLGLISKAGGDPKSAHWRKAERLLMFPEPKEFALGMAMGSPFGSGTGPEFSGLMADALAIVARHHIAEIEFVDVFTLFVEGLGPDRISDIFCNILKGRFIAYTQNVCVRKGIACVSTLTRHARWSLASARWSDDYCDLPQSPVTESGVLLVPKRFLRDIPAVTAWGFWNWAGTNAGAVLRDDLNYDLAESLSRAQRDEEGRNVARKRPDVAFQYLGYVAEQDHQPYDHVGDPDGLVSWHEAGRRGFDPGLVPDQASNPEAFCEWVGDLLKRFKHAIEETELWTVLWNDDHTRPRREKIVQATAGSLLAAYCEAADVDLSREANIGRGAVDFKFSAGWRRRALVEAKLISSSHFSHGAAKQLPQYLASERIDCGYYLCVGFHESDFRPDRLQLVYDTCTALSNQKHKTITPIVVDARPKPSASKL